MNLSQDKPREGLRLADATPEDVVLFADRAEDQVYHAAAIVKLLEHYFDQHETSNIETLGTLVSVGHFLGQLYESFRDVIDDIGFVRSYVANIGKEAAAPVKQPAPKKKRKK